MESRDLLVVEDDPELNEIVGAYAEIAGFHYRPALNGTDALAEIERHAPTAIVLDLMLPDMSGFDVCAKVKGLQRTNHIPVIILTALDSDASRRRGLECGATEYLTKPFDPDVLMRAISRHATGNGRVL
jgi:two-component system cell cycle response regulator